MVTTRFTHLFEFETFLNMRGLGSHNGVAEGSSFPECYGVSPGKATDISKDHNFSIFRVKQSSETSWTLFFSPDDPDTNQKRRSTEFSLHSTKHLNKIA
jgi:hypothetical protein